MPINILDTISLLPDGGISMFESDSMQHFLFSDFDYAFDAAGYDEEEDSFADDDSLSDFEDDEFYEDDDFDFDESDDAAVTGDDDIDLDDE
jgi:hypothetical protein